MDIFAGDDLRECYNYDMGSVSAADDIGKLISISYAWIFYDPYKTAVNCCIISNTLLILQPFYLGMTIYHSLTDGGKFDWVQVTKYILVITIYIRKTLFYVYMSFQLQQIG